MSGDPGAILTGLVLGVAVVGWLVYLLIRTAVSHGIKRSK